MGVEGIHGRRSDEEKKHGDQKAWFRRRVLARIWVQKDQNWNVDQRYELSQGSGRILRGWTRQDVTLGIRCWTRGQGCGGGKVRTWPRRSLSWLCFRGQKESEAFALQNAIVGSRTTYILGVPQSGSWHSSEKAVASGSCQLWCSLLGWEGFSQIHGAGCLHNGEQESGIRGISIVSKSLRCIITIAYKHIFLGVYHVLSRTRYNHQDCPTVMAQNSSYSYSLKSVLYQSHCWLMITKALTVSHYLFHYPDDWWNPYISICFLQ